MAFYPDYARPVGFQQLAAFSTVQKLTVPAGATYAVISVDTNPVRYRSDGTVPTASIGIYLPVASSTTPGPFLFPGGQLLAAVQFIPTTGSATLNVEYYK